MAAIVWRPGTAPWRLPSACGDGGARHGGFGESAEEDDVQGEPAPYWATPRAGLRPPSLCGAALPAFASINKSGVVPGAAAAVRPALLTVPARPAVVLSCRPEPGPAQSQSPRASPQPNPAHPAGARELLVQLDR